VELPYPHIDVETLPAAPDVRGLTILDIGHPEVDLPQITHPDGAEPYLTISHPLTAIQRDPLLNEHDPLGFPPLATGLLRVPYPRDSVDDLQLCRHRGIGREEEIELFSGRWDERRVLRASGIDGVGHGGRLIPQRRVEDRGIWICLWGH